MARSTCKDCGATFGDAGAAAIHTTDFHPGTEAAARAAARAEKQRSAETAETVSSGGGDKGGDGSPASEPEASASGEAGTPPEK